LEHKLRYDPPLSKAFTSFMSEIGQQIKMAAALLRPDVCKFFASRKIIFAAKHLG
jgi:hypothetical protein